MEFYELKKFFNKNLLIDLLNGQITEEMNFSLDATQISWKKCNFNIIQIKQDYQIDSNEFSNIFEHNCQVINSLKDGDVVKIEGYKVLNAIVLYHHTALITGIKIIKKISL